MQTSGLQLAASLEGEKPPDGLADMLAVYMEAELAADNGFVPESTGAFAPATDMVAWINDGNAHYYPVLLRCVEAQRSVIAGVVVLGFAVQREPHIPGELAGEIARALLRAGDVTGAEGAR